MMIVNGVQRPGEGLRAARGEVLLLACPVLEPPRGLGGPLPLAMTIPYVGLSDSKSRLLPVQPATAQGAAGPGLPG